MILTKIKKYKKFHFLIDTVVCKVLNKLPFPLKLVDIVTGYPISKDINILNINKYFKRELIIWWFINYLKTKITKQDRDKFAIVSSICNKKEVPFIYFSPTSYPDIFSEACALNEKLPQKGVLVVLRESSMAGEETKKQFAELISLDGNINIFGNLFLVYYIFRKFKYKFVIIRTFPAVTYALVLISAAIRCPIIYRPSGFINQERIPRSSRFPGLDKSVERLILQKSSLVIHNYTNIAIKYLESHLGIDNINHLPIRPGINENIIKNVEIKKNYTMNEDEIQIVWFGTYTPPWYPVSKEQTKFEDFWGLLTQDNIHVHCYYSHLNTDDPIFLPLKRKFRNNLYFHLHNPIPFNQLYGEIQKYDFIWAFFKTPFFDLHEPFRNFISSHDCLGLHAGLPVIVNEFYEPLYSITNEYGIGIAVKSSDISQLPDIIKNADRAQLRANCLRHKEEFAFPSKKLQEKLASLKLLDL